MTRWPPRLALVATLFLVVGGANAQLAPTPAVPTLAPLVERILPGVVSIAVRGHAAAPDNPLQSDPFFRRFFGVPDDTSPQQSQEFAAAGSGVVVDAPRGYVLTNNHVVANADEITVVLSDGQRMPATKVGADPETDLAVLHVAADHLTALPLGDSSKLRVGDYVVAVGNPFGLSQTVTMGIVSALGRSGLGIEGYEDFIQTDAAINPGNSGGALVDLNGLVVGINSAIVGPSGGNVGIGFAIPMNMARSVMEELIAHGEIKRGQLGVTIQDLTPDLAKALKLDLQSGAVVNQVLAGSAAERAGVQAGDVISAIDGQPVRGATDLRNQVGLMRAGATVKMTVVRKGANLQLDVVLAAPQTQTLAAPAEVPLLDTVVLGPVPPEAAGGQLSGAAVIEVDPDSPAGQAGLMAGDVVVAVNQQPVRTPADVMELAARDKALVFLQVMRPDGMRFIVISK